MAVNLIDPHKFRHALGHYASGITVVSGIVNDAPVGFTCQSFCGVSTDPPLVSFCVMKESRSWPKLRAVGNFSINVLSADQKELSTKFARPTSERWADVQWTINELNNPVIADVLLCLDCHIHAEHEAGDHWISIGRVDRLVTTSNPRHSPLLYYKSRYHQLNEARVETTVY
jgi:3-hydroxy-9,10-secoandrosta-1,3,5(10)-triene-9,17-dione monooxygenase reductase component